MKKNKANKIVIRNAESDDVEGMLEIEISRYGELYTDKEAIAKTEDRFRRRVKVAQEWMWVAEQGDKIVGFTTGQPTNSEPKDFKSWEESTDNGTLEKTFNASGQSVYVVNLDVSREAAKQNAQYMLMAQLGAKCVRLGKTKVIFESRMPGFRDYVAQDKKTSLKEWEGFSDKKKMAWAQDYSGLRIQRNGKSVPKDRLLRFYYTGGFKLEKVFANAFEDPESLDYGMLCTGGNPVPRLLRIAPVNYLFSKLFEKVGNNPSLLDKFVG